MSKIDIKTFFSNYLSELRSKVNNSSYSHTYSDNFYCYFYEWSDMSRPGKRFNNRDELFKFFRDSQISFTEEDVKYIHSHNLVYGICVSGSGKLLLADKYIDIRDKFNKEKFKETQKVINKI